MNCKYARTVCSYHVLNSTWSAECAEFVIELVIGNLLLHAFCLYASHNSVSYYLFENCSHYVVITITLLQASHAIVVHTLLK